MRKGRRRLRLKHRWMESLDFAIGMSEDARRWTPRLLLFGVLTAIPSVYVVVEYGFGEDLLAKFLRVLLLVLPISGLGTGLLYLALQGTWGAILDLPVEGERGRGTKGLERALEEVFREMGLRYTKGPGFPEARVTYKLPEGIRVQVISGPIGEYAGRPYSIAVRINRVFERNRSLAEELVSRVDGMPFWDGLGDIVRTDIVDDPGYWEH